MRSRPGRAAALSIGAVALTMVVAGCGAGEADPAGAGDAAVVAPASGGNTDEATQRLDKYAAARDTYTSYDKITNLPDLKGKTVWYVPFGASSPIMQTIAANLTEALGHVGAEVHVCDGKFQPTEVSNCLGTAATQGAAAVVMGAIDYSLVPTAVDALVDKNIPVLVGMEPEAPNAPIGKNLQFLDNSEQSKVEMSLAADAAIADSKGTAHALFIRLTASATTIAGADAGVAQLEACGGCTVTTVDTSIANIAKLGSAISAALVSHPDTNYLVGVDDARLQSVLPGIQSAGFADKLKIVTVGGNTSALQQVQSGEIHAVVGQGPTYIGWALADGILRQLAGMPITALTDEGIRVWTKDNVEGLELTAEAYETTDWYGGDQWQKDMLASWGAS